MRVPARFMHRHADAAAPAVGELSDAGFACRHGERHVPGLGYILLRVEEVCMKAMKIVVAGLGLVVLAGVALAIMKKAGKHAGCPYCS